MVSHSIVDRSYSPHLCLHSYSYIGLEMDEWVRDRVIVTGTGDTCETVGIFSHSVLVGLLSVRLVSQASRCHTR